MSLVAQRDAYLDSLRPLPCPSTAQREAFREHLCNAHSWYKHLPLLSGAQFVVLMAADAGAGFETRERMHYGWKTTAEYRARFGFLDYAWRLDEDTNYQRDGIHPDVGSTPPDWLLPEQREPLSLRLFPMVSTDFNAMESIHYDLHADDLARLRAGAPHPHRARVVKWAELDARIDALYQQLDEAESEALQTIDQLHDLALTRAEETSETAPSLVEIARGQGFGPENRVSRYFAAEEALNANYEHMQGIESAKITAALADLTRWHESL